MKYIDRPRERKRNDVTYDQVSWSILRICALLLTHPKCTHTLDGALDGTLFAKFTHRVPCSRAPQSWYWGWRECCTFTPPTYNSCRPEIRTCNLSIRSLTLTIRPRKFRPIKPFFMFKYRFYINQYRILFWTFIDHNENLRKIWFKFENKHNFLQ